MKKIVLFGKENITLELAAIFLFALVLIANLVVVRFAEGYFGYFDISLAQVNFVPQMYDYVRIAVPVLIVAGVVTFIMFLSMKLGASTGDFLASKIKLGKKLSRYIKRHKKFLGRLFATLDFIMTVGLVGFILCVLWSGITGFAMTSGKLAAESTTQFSSISSPDDDLQEVVVYKGDNEIITKTYDVSKKKFLDGHRVIVAESYEVRRVNLQ